MWQSIKKAIIWLGDLPFRLTKKTYLVILALFALYLGAFFIYSWTASAKRAAYPTGGFWATFFKPARVLSGMFSGSKGKGTDLSELVVRTVVARPVKHADSMKTVGIIEHFEKVEIGSKTPGKIERFYVQEGQVIRKGQKLLQIERVLLHQEMVQLNAAYKASLAEKQLSADRYNNARLRVEKRFQEINKQATMVKKLQADLEKSRTTFEGKKLLVKEGGISAEEFAAARNELIGREAAYLMARRDLNILQIGYRDKDLKAKGIKVPRNKERRKKRLIDLNTAIENSEVRVARSRVEAAKASMGRTNFLLKSTTIRSPINGMVAGRNKSVGEQVTGGSVSTAAQAIMILVDIYKVYAVINIKESDLRNIELGQELTFKVDAYPDKDYRGKLTIISPIVDPQTHTIKVKALIDNPGLKLRPGMYIRASIITNLEREVFLIPAKAVLPQKDKKSRVFIVRDNTVYKQVVETGERLGDNIIVNSGLQPGVRVVIENLAELSEGQKVKIAREQKKPVRQKQKINPPRG